MAVKIPQHIFSTCLSNSSCVGTEFLVIFYEIIRNNVSALAYNRYQLYNIFIIFILQSQSGFVAC